MTAFLIGVIAGFSAATLLLGLCHGMGDRP